MKNDGSAGIPFTLSCEGPASVPILTLRCHFPTLCYL
jgi:hypothetical protein